MTGEVFQSGRRLAALGVLALAIFHGAMAPQAQGEDPDQIPPAAAKPAGRWHNSLQAGIIEARQRKTTILVRVGAESCGWCRKLDTEFAKAEVQRELASWTLVMLDAENDDDDVSQLRVGPIPALRILNASGRVLRMHNGYLPSEELVAWIRGRERDTPDALRDDVEALPELTPQSVKDVVRLLAHREASVREAVARRLAANRELAASDVVTEFSRGQLASRLAALDLLTEWQAPVQGLDPWRPETITGSRLEALEQWGARISAEAKSEDAPAEALTSEQLAQARADILRLTSADPLEAEAIGARLARFGKQLFPLVTELRQQAETDRVRERLDWLRYRLVASDALMLKWPGGLARLTSTDARQRHEAAGELAKVATTGDEMLLLELFGHSDPLVRELSLKALHDVGGQRSSQELTKLLSDPEPNVRAAVLKQFAEKPAPSMVPAIEAYIEHEKDPDLIVHAVRLLREIKTDDALLCLLKLFPHEVWQVRAEAVDAVGEAVSPRNQSNSKASAETVTKAKQAVLKMLDDTDAFVISRSANALKDANLAAAAEPLAKAAERQPELAVMVAEALVQGNASTQGLPLLKAWLKHPDENLRSAALARLQKSGKLDDDQQIVQALSDRSEKVRITAADLVLAVCETHRPAKPRATAGVRPQPAPPVAPPVSIGGVLGSLFTTRSPRNPPPAPERAAPPKPSAPAPVAVGEPAVPDPAAEPPAKVAQESKEEQLTPLEIHPYEDWLVQFRAGEKRVPVLTKAIEPLLVMAKSQSAAETLAAGIPLVALGRDGDVLADLRELAAKQSTLIVPVAKGLRWLPWESRLATFQALLKSTTGNDEIGGLCEQFVFLRDLRTADPVWDVLASPQMDAPLAHALFVNLLHVHGIEMRYGMYIDNSQPHDPIGFKPGQVQKLALESPHEWQRRVALALLLQCAPEKLQEAAAKLLDDVQAPGSIRADAFVASLRDQDRRSAERAAVKALQDSRTPYARVALLYLTHGPSSLDAFANGHFHLPNRTNVQFSDDDKDELPKGLEPEHLEAYVASSDRELAAAAAYVLARLGDGRGMDLLIARWREAGGSNGNNETWDRLVYRAIAGVDDPRFVPVLTEIYSATREHDPHTLRDFYWTIRSMHGPEILALRKRMRDEVGMDQLR